MISTTNNNVTMYINLGLLKTAMNVPVDAIDWTVTVPLGSIVVTGKSETVGDPPLTDEQASALGRSEGLRQKAYEAASRREHGVGSAYEV